MSGTERQPVTSSGFPTETPVALCTFIIRRAWRRWQPCQCSYILLHHCFNTPSPWVREMLIGPWLLELQYEQAQSCSQQHFQQTQRPLNHAASRTSKRMQSIIIQKNALDLTNDMFALLTSCLSDRVKFHEKRKCICEISKALASVSHLSTVIFLSNCLNHCWIAATCLFCHAICPKQFHVR